MSVTWIEASAGTGKTYMLVQTVLRLVVEEGLPVDQILMVTFTEKATAELKTRIRQGLREAWKATGEPRLAQALEELPALSVTTIHGFCRTLLTQFPLESGVSFEPEMVDQGRQWRRLLREELRPRLISLDPALLAWARVEGEEELLALAQEALDRNLLALPLLHPDTREQALFLTYRTQLEQGNGPLAEALRGLADLSLPEDARQAFGDTAFETHLHARNHKGAYQLVRRLAAVRNFRDWIPLLSEESLKTLARWEEGGSLWKGKGQPPFEGVLETVRTAALGLLEAVQDWTSVLPPGVGLGDFLAGAARHALVEDLCRPVLRRRSPRELTFHDLIDRVRTLVAGPEGAALSRKAAARWKAVLIDEFQDTDPEQWDIFRGLFSDPGHQLVLVGDPKQSIYRFRGADLEVYRTVRGQVKAEGAQTLILEENFRSTAAMIEAVNDLFHPSRAPWEHPDDFLPSRKGSKAVGELIRKISGSAVPVPPLAVYQDADERTWHRHLVRTVAEFLDGSYWLDDGTRQTPVSPGDFLILVRKKKEAWALYRLLTAQGIPATVGGSGGLLRGREAREILLFLKALENPRSLPAARALAWTRLFAGADLDQLMPALDEARADRDRGAFLRAFRRVAAALEPGVPDGGGLDRLLELPEGPRIVTNAEHVLELVQERHHRGEVPPGQAALSLETWIRSGLQEDEVDLRRDGEARTLRLMTVHAAKGLEAPIVLHGKPSESRKDEAPWIIAGGVDFLRTDESREAEEKNRRAEDLRLRYVALTRARTHQVFLDPGHPQAIPVPEGTDEPVRGGVAPWEAPPAVPDLAPALAGLETRHPWVESHSGLWRRATREESAERTVWDRPAVRREDEGPSGPEPSDSLPAGPLFGDLVHDLLEAVDFRAWAPGASRESREAADAIVEELCQRSRAALGGRDLSRPLSAWIGETLNHRFSLGEGTPPLVFSALGPEETRRELEFHLPLAPGAPETFDWGGRIFAVHPGYLTGRIDLLFRWEGKLYLADWKTNRLAPDQNPAVVMTEAGYDLQAQWYWEALNRLSALQREPLLPGGVLYVFLRGAGDGPRGVFLSPGTLDSNQTLSPFLWEARRG